MTEGTRARRAGLAWGERAMRAMKSGWAGFGSAGRQCQQWHTESRSYGRDTAIKRHNQPLEESAPDREGGAVHEDR